MGTQDEYLRNFAILLTEKGVIPLTDPMQIAVYNELCSGSKRPSDISASLGIPSSSLHFVLDKMTDSGVIVKSKPDPDKKSVYYSNLALKIAASAAPAEGAEEACKETFMDPSRHYSGMASVANMLNSYSAEIGLDLDQMRSRYATELADSMKLDIGTGSLEDKIGEIRARFSAVTGFRFSVFSLNPLTLVFEGDPVMASSIDMLSAFVGRAVENATGRSYAIVSLEDFSADSARFKVTYERAEKVPEPYINMSLHHSADADRFLMVELDGSVGLITSPVQIDIVDAVYERPLCVTDIVNKVEAPRSTVTSNILRMVEDGVISVFYSESGSAYYGMSCSILMKKARGINRDNTELRGILSDTRSRDGSFMEGYLLYLLSSLRGLGFDTDYMMVVLGAKYMRVAGNDGPRNFDVFFGKMSAVAHAIGISMNVVSIYPLTIGIASDDPDSKMYPAMTFVKGMAHQGLEMASNGIFVRVSDDTPADRKVSFKEIYPALSMTPAEGMSVEGLADAAGAKKKRTSSVKTALLNRSAKEVGRPTRSVRYITGVVMVTLMAALMIFGFSGVGSPSEAEQYSVTLSEGCDGVMFYDDAGNEMQMPLTVGNDEVVEFSVTFTGATTDIGVLDSGVAYLISDYLQAGEGDTYTITVSQDIVFRPIHQIEIPDDAGLTYEICTFGSSVSDSYAMGHDGFMSLEEYIAKAGGLWVTSGTVFRVASGSDSYISTSDSGEDLFYLQTLVCGADEVASMSSASLPRSHVDVHLQGGYEADGWYVEGMVKVASDSRISMKFLGTNGLVSITMTDENGNETALRLSDIDRTVTFDVEDQDVVISYRHVGIY